ncbi:MAG: glycosyltransferase [Rudaea sp.]
MISTATWLGWDGRCLRWRIDADTHASVELRIDGIVFERMAMTSDIASREFDYSPTGHPDLEFSLCDGEGAELTTPWRVTHGRPALANVSQWHGATPPMGAIPTMRATHSRRPVAVVVPIFNAAALVERCIESVIRWTSAPAHLVLIDDASTDPAIDVLLRRYAGHSHVSILRNAENLGYTKSSNLGIARADGADVVLLNSDTHVGPRWLDRLSETAYSDASIGTVTAVSDNAGAFSVPELERFCPIPERWTLEQTQRALLQRVLCPDPALPTGNGFCMFMKRAMLDTVGVLDAEAFPFGYGEENDLCQRAERAGYRHVIAGDVFVAHARSASFGDERRAELGARGMAVLRQRYPDYEAKVGATLFGFARRVLDYRVRRIYADSDGVYAEFPPRARCLRVLAHAEQRSEINVSGDFETFVTGGENAAEVYGHDGRWQKIAHLDDPGAYADWLIESSIECVCADENAGAVSAWHRAAEKVAVPFVRCPPAATDIALRCRHAWNSIAAFRSD